MDIVKNNPDNHQMKKSIKNRIFFNLKEQSLIQKILIDTLLIKTNYDIDDLALILHTDKEKLHRVWLEKDKLTSKEAEQLVSLFYILSS